MFVLILVILSRCCHAPCFFFSYLSSPAPRSPKHIHMPMYVRLVWIPPSIFLFYFFFLSSLYPYSFSLSISPTVSVSHKSYICRFFFVKRKRKKMEIESKNLINPSYSAGAGELKHLTYVSVTSKRWLKVGSISRSRPVRTGGFKAKSWS
jgi:hypothetical protein